MLGLMKACLVHPPKVRHCEKQLVHTTGKTPSVHPKKLPRENEYHSADDENDSKEDAEKKKKKKKKQRKLLKREDKMII